MNLLLTEAFLRDYRRVDPQEQAGVFRAVVQLGPALSQPHQHSGLGLRKLHPKGLYEIRVGLKLRAVFFLERNTAVFVFLGSHDEVNRFVRDFRP